MNAVAAIDQEFREVVPSALRKETRTAKIIALFVGATPRAVESWRNGYHGPQVPHFFALAREIPELKAAALRWLQADQELDPDTQRLTDELTRLVSDHMNRRK